MDFILSGIEIHFLSLRGFLLLSSDSCFDILKGGRFGSFLGYGNLCRRIYSNVAVDSIVQRRRSQ